MLEEKEKIVYELFDNKKLLVGEMVNVDMLGEGYDILVFAYRENKTDNPIPLFCEYGAMFCMTNEDAISKYTTKIYEALVNKNIIK